MELFALLVTGLVAVAALVFLVLRLSLQRGWVPPGDHPLLRLTRRIIGWPLVLVGLVLTPLPIPFGVPLVTVGVLLIGTRDRVVRTSYVHIRRALRGWAGSRLPLVGWSGRFVLARQQQLARLVRQRFLARIVVSPTHVLRFYSGAPDNPHAPHHSRRSRSEAA